MTINRRRMVALGTGMLAFGAAECATPSVASNVASSPNASQPKAEFLLRFANNLAPNHPSNIRGREMAAAIRAETRGRVDLQIFPESQLGSDTEMLRKLSAGEIDFLTLSGVILSSLVPSAAITGLGFAFPNYTAVWAALDGDVGAHIRAQIAKETNLVAMDRVWDNGFRQITTSTRAITNASDLRGMKLRVPVAPLWTSLFTALEALPTPISFPETYAALKSVAVEGQENPLAVVDTAKLYEIQKYCSQTFHMWDGFWLLANRAAWERLPQDYRGIVAKHASSAAVQQRVDIAILNAMLQKQLREKGMVFNQPSPDSFRSQLRKAGFYSEWKKNFDPGLWASLEQHTGRLG